MSVRKFLKRLVRTALCLIAGLLAFAACAYTDYRLWPLDLPPSAQPRVPVAAVRGGHLAVPITPELPAAEVASYNDQLEAFLRFEYIRGRLARDGQDASKVLLNAENTAKGPRYRVFVVTDNNLLTALPQLAKLESRNLIAGYEFQSWTQKDLAYFQTQSHMFDTAYDVTTGQKLETLSSFQLRPALAQFLMFKSETDNRVVGGDGFAPQPLTREKATQLATDILDVAQFYDLPLDYFLGVGAMENDYMDVDGDLTHAVWKKRAQRGDIVLRRTRKRVMVSDYAIGTWQITRETLRAAHVLYLRDKRDYSKLPARLRPARELDLNSVNDAALTTYAGLLLRDLLDHFGGDVDKAIGAYNGGVKTPNSAYASSVKTIADYARRILEHATGPDEPVASAENPGNSQTSSGCATGGTNVDGCASLAEFNDASADNTWVIGSVTECWEGRPKPVADLRVYVLTMEGRNKLRDDLQKIEALTSRKAGGDMQAFVKLYDDLVKDLEALGELDGLTRTDKAGRFSVKHLKSKQEYLILAIDWDRGDTDEVAYYKYQFAELRLPGPYDVDLYMGP